MGRSAAASARVVITQARPRLTPRSPVARLRCAIVQRATRTPRHENAKRMRRNQRMQARGLGLFEVSRNVHGAISEFRRDAVA